MVRLIIAFSFLSALCASAQTPAISCAGGSNAVQEGQSITCTASSAVTWSLQGVGSLTNQSSTNVTYTAPASVRPQNTLYGCPVLPNDSVYNTRIDSLPVSASSATWIANVGGAGINFIGSWGHSYADASTPTGPIKVYYGSYQVSSNFVLPVSPYLKRENGAYRSHYDNNDHHQLAVRVTDCTFWEIYNTYTNDLNPTGACQDGSTGCNSTAAIGYSWANYGVTGGTDAAGLPLAALTLHLDEIKAGAVNHALRFTSCAGCIYNGTLLWPAAATNGCPSGLLNVNGIDCSNSPPMGARFRLKSSFDISGYSPDAQAVLKGLQQYGMYISDIGGMNQITVDSDISNDSNAQAALGSVTGIPMSDFEVVDESSLMVNGGSIQSNPNNGHVTPNNSAVITATPSTGSAVSIPIAIEGVTVGVNSPNIYVMAGNYSFQIPSWVEGTSNNSVIWSLVSGVGSVTAGGVYTPPADTSGGTAATLKAASAADPNAITYVYVTVLSAGSNPAGSLRIDTGGGGGTDGNGNVWLPDQGFEAGAYIQMGDYYPGWSNAGSASNPELSIYESLSYTYGSDFVYNFIVPNGNYKIRFMMGQPYDGSPGYMTTFSLANHGRFDLEAQGMIGAHNFNFGLNEPTGFKQIVGVPSDEYIPARVTGNNLEIAMRGVFYQADLTAFGTNCMSCMAPELSGLEIVPDSTPAHWAIDTQQSSTVAPGGTLQLYVVDWYTGLSDGQWSIVSGPGTISSTGLYTAPTTQPSAGTAVIIQAQSASNPSVTATATLYMTGSVLDIK